MKPKNVSNKESEKPDFLVFLFFFIFVLILLIAGILFTLRHSNAMVLINPTYDVSSECSLSLCDCTCYRTEELPEVLEQKVCANDCRGLFGIESCNLINETCIPELK